MADNGVQSERVKRLNDRPIRKGRYVLYWMQAAQREEYNHALEYAAAKANRLGLPLLACFGLTDRFPGANLRHYAFMLEGLRETAAALSSRRGVALAVRRGPPDDVAIALSGDAALLVTDRGYLRVQREWQRRVREKATCAVVQVETDVVVPVEVVSNKEEYAARTIRPRIHRHLSKFIVPIRRVGLRRGSMDLDVPGEDLSDIEGLLAALDIDRSVPPSPLFRGGVREAKRRLRRFLRKGLAGYPRLRGEPALDGVSHMSPYLHFGQISPLYIALQARRAREAPVEAREAFLEELIVRRELSMNFVLRNPKYDRYVALPAWARRSLARHARDARPYRYGPKRLENARTHDPFWNAAQREMMITGKMHNTMRMYWGKKIIEWSASPEEAFRRALYLNNKYELDGRDPNSFAGVAWCFGKHDRPWTERPVFGYVRYMNDRGLRRKYDMDAYLRKIASLEAPSCPTS